MAFCKYAAKQVNSFVTIKSFLEPNDRNVLISHFIFLKRKSDRRWIKKYEYWYLAAVIKHLLRCNIIEVRKQYFLSPNALTPFPFLTISCGSLLLKHLDVRTTYLLSSCMIKNTQDKVSESILLPKKKNLSVVHTNDITHHFYSASNCLCG